jgi:aminopeptidase N
MAPKCRFFADILLLPPSFPYGGMENPCLTFVTPTLLAVRKR